MNDQLFSEAKFAWRALIGRLIPTSADRAKIEG